MINYFFPLVSFLVVYPQFLSFSPNFSKNNTLSLPTTSITYVTCSALKLVLAYWYTSGTYISS